MPFKCQAQRRFCKASKALQLRLSGCLGRRIPVGRPSDQGRKGFGVALAVGIGDRREEASDAGFGALGLVLGHREWWL